MIKLDSLLYNPVEKKFYVNVNGSLIELGGGNDAAPAPEYIVTVDALPDSGEAGKVYYNSTDGKYYVYANDTFNIVGDCVNVVDELPETGEAGKIYVTGDGGKLYVGLNDGDWYHWVPLSEVSNMPIGSPERDDRNNTYTIDPNTYYNLGSIHGTGANQGDPAPKIVLRGYPRSDIALQYVGRFTVEADSQPFSFVQENSSALSVGPFIPDEDAEIEITAGHTYEFNILYDIVILKDISHDLIIIEP